MRAVQNAIAALGPRAFRESFWDQKLAHLTRMAVAAETSDMVAQLSEFLGRTDIRYPSLRLAKDGQEIPLENYTKELRLGPHRSHDWIVNERVFHWYRQGATIILQMLQNSLPSYGLITNELEQLFGSTVQASCFITPPKAQGFTAHYDTYSFFAVQLFGSKKWSFYDSTARLPIRDDREDDDAWTPVPPTAEIELREGDVIYVPRGLYHSAVTSELASIHLTIGVFSYNHIDAIRAALIDTQAFPQSRRGLHADQFGEDADQADMSEIQGILRDSVDPARGVERLREQVFSNHVDTRQHRLEDVLHLHEVSGEAKYAVHRIPFRMYARDGRACLEFADKRVTFPEFLMPILQQICRRERFRGDDLSELVDDASLNVLLRRLVAEGFLTFEPRCTGS